MGPSKASSYGWVWVIGVGGLVVLCACCATLFWAGRTMQELLARHAERSERYRGSSTLPGSPSVVPALGLLVMLLAAKPAAARDACHHGVVRGDTIAWESAFRISSAPPRW